MLLKSNRQETIIAKFAQRITDLGIKIGRYCWVINKPALFQVFWNTLSHRISINILIMSLYSRTFLPSLMFTCLLC